MLIYVESADCGLNPPICAVGMRNAAGRTSWLSSCMNAEVWLIRRTMRLPTALALPMK